MQWSEFAAGLTEEDHRRLVLALGTGLHEARRAAEIADRDGDLDELRAHVAAALAWLNEIQAVLGGP